MNIEQERAAFEAWARRELRIPFGMELNWDNETVQNEWRGWQARAALQSQPTEAFPCRIIEADFETGTVTLEMQGKYTVSAGQKYLCNAPLQSQDREDDPLQTAANWLIQAIEGCTVGDIQGRLSISYNRAKRLFDHARRAEG